VLEFPQFPDPIVSANVYASSLLDEVISGAVLPFWRNLRSSSRDGRSYLWMVRYSRGGEHLKLRVHAAAEKRDALKEMLGDCVESYLHEARKLPPAVPRNARHNVPPIDAEEEAGREYPDRSLLWTSYRRSRVTMGAECWLTDDRFAAYACECMARGGERLLAALEDGLSLSPVSRQKLLMKMLLSAWSALGFQDLDRAAAYLQYHRDWLLRFFLDEAEKEHRAIAQFDLQVSHMAAACERLRSAVHAASEAASSHPLEDWPGAVTGFVAYLGTFQGQSDHQADPFTEDVTFPPIFKLLHNLANQVGLPFLEEAYTYHLMLTSVELCRGQGEPVPAFSRASSVKRGDE